MLAFGNRFRRANYAIHSVALPARYLYWSLLDNYEWGSFAPTFGLIEVDREGDFARSPKPSLAWLGGVARDGGVLPD